MTDKKITPEQIKKARKSFGFTQKYSAELINVDRVSWSRYESGEREMSIDKFELFNRKAKEMKEKSYFTFHDLAVLNIGGQHPQTVSGLTSSQGGDNFLLPSMPPVASFNYNLTKETKTIFDLTFGWHLKKYFSALANAFVTKDTLDEKEIVNDLEIILGLSIKKIMQFQEQVKNDTESDWQNLDDISLKILKLREKTTRTRSQTIKEFNYFIASNLSYILNNMQLVSYFVYLLDNIKEWQKLCKLSFDVILSDID